MFASASLGSVLRGENVMADGLPPAKHLPHGNYARADWFEARCKELEKELDDMTATLKAANDMNDGCTCGKGESHGR